MRGLLDVVFVFRPAQIGFAHPLVLRDFIGISSGQDRALCQNSDRIGDAENDCHVVFDDDDVDRAGHFPDFGNRALGFRRTHPASRFIEQQQLRFGNKRHSDLEEVQHLHTTTRRPRDVPAR